MPTFEQKGMTSEHATAAKSTISGRLRVQQSHPGNSNIQLTARDRISNPLTVKDAARFGHDFSRIAVHGNAPQVLQAKMTISTPGDAGEQEAERVADEVMRMPDREADSSSQAAPLSASTTLQRMCRECAEHEEGLQGKGGGSEADEIDGRVASGIRDLQGSGSPLPTPSRAFFEPRFGHDFAAVRIHTDSRAAGLARSVDARAFTLGESIVFGSGEYSPESGEGKRLLAHELAHVVQQGHAQPHIQRLAITRQAFTKGTCGGRNIQWVFSLDKSAPDDGYIVQQVDKSEFVATCPDVANGPPAPLPTYWEAWFVKKGDKEDWTTVRDKWTDSNSRPNRPGTNGSDMALGTVKFFTKATTGDLGDFGQAPADPKSAWGPGKVPTSGALPSTPSEPSWWSGAAVEGPANRQAQASWNCCDADKAKQTFDLSAKP
jgi:hypothetical protein